tara:strand:+ start:5640 stop:6197 length:558 start_codon:yes stop_codon:yes gene_type:complete
MSETIRLAEVLRAAKVSYRILHAMTKEGLIESPVKGPNPQGQGQVSLYPVSVIDKIRQVQNAKQGRWAGYKAAPVEPPRQSGHSFYHVSGDDRFRCDVMPFTVLIREGDRASMGWALEHLESFQHCSKISSQGSEAITGTAWVAYNDMGDPVDVAPVTAEGEERILLQYGGHHVEKVKIVEGGKL